jgi:hypothetical protein
VDVAILEQGIAEHRAEGWGHRHGEAEVDSVPNKALHHVEEGEVSFGYRFIQPILLKKFGIFGMTNEGEMGVENWSYITEGHNCGRD